MVTQFFEVLQNFVVAYGMRVLGALVLIIVGYLTAKIVSGKMEKLVLRRQSIDPSVAAIVRRGTFVTVMLMVFIAVLERFGVETTSFIAVLGAAGLAIGLALQGTLSNIAAGVMLLVLRPFRAGDAVQVGGGEVYIIDEIGLFVTRAHKPDCPRVMIPNAKIWGDTITNFSNTFDGFRRFDIIFGISYSDSISDALVVLEKLAADDDRVLKDPPPFVKVDSLGDSSVNILFRVHTKAADWWDAKLDLTKNGKEALEAAGKTIPFPQRDVHLIQSN
ncbi:MAG: mechanosensitive ion channel [Deltaproteobacteria bacterium]|nr:mechanosensitive ion channel [Deltaproteobacteria bacterium]